MKYTSDAFAPEEYRMLSDRVGDAERAMLQLYSGTILASVSLTAALLAYTESRNPSSSLMGFAYAYAFFLPLFFVIPAFHMIISQRKDLLRHALYLRVFFDEVDTGAKFEVRLEHFRKQVPGESMKHVPLSFWGLVMICNGLFLFRLSCIGTSALITHGSLIILPIMLILTCHLKFERALKQDFGQILTAWREVRKTETRRSEPLD